MEEIDILINNIENRNYHRQIKTKTSKFTYRLKYWFYDFLMQYSNIIMFFIIFLFMSLIVGLTCCFMINNMIVLAIITSIIGIPFSYVLLCSLIPKLMNFARQLRDEIS